jgi:hypothetical protein
MGLRIGSMLVRESLDQVSRFLVGKFIELTGGFAYQTMFDILLAWG